MTGARARLGAACLLAALALAACGEDEDLPTPASETIETTPERSTSTSTTSTTSTSPTTTDDTGGIVVPDEGHEGGGPDPGTNEGGVNAEPGDDSGGDGEAERGDDSGGQSAPDRFEDFCEDDPAACE